MKKLVVSLIAAFAACSGSMARASEVYGQVGTEGFGIGYGYSFASMANVRAEFNGFSFSHSFTAGGLQYDATLNLYHGGLYGDFFPAPTILPFRLTAGVLLGGDNLDATATAMSGTYTINGTTYSSLGEQIHAKVKYPAVRPYIGFGFGHSPLAKKGFSMFFDAGVAYGKPHVDFNVPADIVAEAGQANVNAEEQELQNKANNWKFYPIVKIGVTYRF
ncbi:hypothetical protein FAZ69_28945 [Trinickia terrae]|uniref:Outer membrane protein beta-barrel domain-containing protein n=1 Tax=Trinickia terrae TaxID=2571161 RepID=A0A4U1HH03_9BURK|nr:hypothetical protein [Trinickia terrae]TKC80345.1 hypothetical protein FAZ69_28945 [Trinickia terrae]